jgi:hypothetical protein
VIGASTNAFKISNSGGGTIENNTYLYNNTMLNSGFRQQKSGRGGSIDYEKGASGKIYNNIIVNCRFGVRFVSADDKNIQYDNQLFYGNAQVLVDQFYSTDGTAKTQLNDIISGTPGANNPKFNTYNVDQFDFSKVSPPLDNSQMPLSILTATGYDFGLLTTSPGYHKGNTSFKAHRTVPQGGDFGATTLDPNVDMGAYPSDGTGNQHFTSSLSSK